MNVLYLTNNGGRASTTVATRGWIEALSDQGLRPTIVSPILGEFANWASGACGAQSYRVSLPPPSKANPIPFLRAVWRLARICKRHKIDLVHCNEQDCCPLGSYVARRAGVPLVVSVHFRMTRPYCEWAFGGRREPDLMYFVSRRVMEECRPALEGVVRESRQRVLHNGLDLSTYQPDDDLRTSFRGEHLTGYEFAIGVACALRPRKQLEHLFEAFSRLTTPGVRMFVAGFAVEGDEEYADALIEGARKRFGERLKFLGSLRDLRPFVNGLDLFVNTSQEESFGIAALEALACGCPVVGYDSKAVDEVVLPDGGEITPQDDRIVLAQTIDRWLADRNRLQLARRRARQQSQRFDIRQISMELWDQYLEVVAPSGRAAAAAAP